VPLEPRAEWLGAVAERHPEALVVTLCLLPSLTALGEAAQVGERILATRYGDPPLLSPVVELLAGRDTPRRLLDRVSQLLRALGKRPLVLNREVPGLVAGRLELALLREAAWLLERGVVEPADLDALVRDSLARRWALAGPVESAALEGRAELLELACENGTEHPSPSSLEALLGQVGDGGGEQDGSVRERRDQGLAAALRADRAAAERAAAADL